MTVNNKHSSFLSVWAMVLLFAFLAQIVCGKKNMSFKIETFKNKKFQNYI